MVSLDFSLLSNPAYLAQTRAPYLLAGNITCFILTWTTTLLRAHVRLRTLRAASWDDYLIFACQVVYTMHLTCQLVGLSYGNGRHLIALPLDHLVPALKCFFLEGLSYVVGIALVKASIGLLLLRFTATRAQAWTVRAAIGVAALFGAMSVLHFLLNCRPISVFWSLSADEHADRCAAPAAWLPLALATAAVSILVDLVYAAVPVWIMHGTTMNRRARLAVCLVLGCGSLSLVEMAVRIPLLVGVDVQYMLDPLYNGAWMALASTLELGLAIVAANGATLRPLFRRLLGGPRSGTAEESGNSEAMRALAAGSGSAVSWHHLFKMGKGGGAGGSGAKGSLPSFVDPGRSQGHDMERFGDLKMAAADAKGRVTVQEVALESGMDSRNPSQAI